MRQHRSSKQREPCREEVRKGTVRQIYLDRGSKGKRAQVREATSGGASVRHAASWLFIHVRIGSYWLPDANLPRTSSLSAPLRARYRRLADSTTYLARLATRNRARIIQLDLATYSVLCSAELATIASSSLSPSSVCITNPAPTNVQSERD